MRKRVAVLRGGPSSEFDVSLKTGNSIIQNLPENVEVFDINVDRSKGWHLDGARVDPKGLARKLDFIINAMHGEYGEDGQVQELLESLNVPYSGPGKLAAALAMNKALSKKVFDQAGLKTPLYHMIRREEYSPEIIVDIVQKHSFPVLLKPVGKGSSLGIISVKHYGELPQLLEEIFRQEEQILVEEFIFGKEATVGVVDNFRDQDHYALMPVEVEIPEDSIFDYDAKYSPETKCNCPGCFSAAEKKALEEMAIKAHKALDLRHYSRSDFRIHPKRGIFILETNALPGLTETSLFPKGLEAVGSNLGEFLEHLIKQK
jgi:D-alanine-D-alanine ligase